jgi:outer membrane immunogenic protein
MLLKELTFRPLQRLAAGVLAAAALAGAAQAQDPRAWTGFYVGVHGGYHWGAGDASLSLLPDAASWGSPDYLPFQRNYDSSPDGALGGAQLGFNWRSGGFVVGLEADLTYLNADGQASYTAFVSDGGSSATYRGQSRQEIDWLGTVRARIGATPFADPRLLVYLTGGLAYGRVETSHSLEAIVPTGANFGASDTSWEVGGTVGGGLEWNFGGGWSLKAEYLYYDLGDRDDRGRAINMSPVPPPEFGTRMSHELNGHIARVGINYQLGAY